jgi:CRP-like cAMP-binding protein
MASNSEFILKALPYAKKLKASPSQDIVDPGEKGGKAYYLEKGTVEVSNRIEDVELLVAIIGEGEFFGETGFFDEGTRVRNIRAIEESIVRIFDHEAARKMLRDNPELHSMFLFTLAKRICSKFRRMIEETRPLDSYAASLTSGTAKRYNVI